MPLTKIKYCNQSFTHRRNRRATSFPRKWELKFPHTHGFPHTRIRQATPFPRKRESIVNTLGFLYTRERHAMSFPRKRKSIAQHTSRQTNT